MRDNEEEITFAWSRGCNRHVALRDWVETASGTVFQVERIEDGPERKVYIFSGLKEGGGECHVTGNEIVKVL